MVPRQDLSRITGATKAIAILGDPVHHSLSPVIHNAAFAAAGLDYCYLALEVRAEDIEIAVRGLRAAHYAGITLTAPHKQSVIPLLDGLTVEARAIGAVNTVVDKDGKWIGTNTDATGFRSLLQLNGLYQKGMKAVLMGSGGAARAAFYVLGQVAGEVVICNRTVERAEQLIQSLSPYIGECSVRALPLTVEILTAELGDADLLVNTTSVGMSPHGEDCPLPVGVELPARCGVADVIYSPPKTRLLQRAEEAGCKWVSGHDMLLYQAVDSFKFWTGVDPDLRVMDQALQSARSL